MLRLVTVIGHGTELIPHFIDHYKSYVDEIQLVIYETDLYPNLKNEVTKAIENQDIVKIVNVTKDRKFDWEKVTYLYNKTKSEHPDDWWVVADIDEFHLYPKDSLTSLVNECDENGWILVRGGFIDRIGEYGEFPEIKPDVKIFEQFPNAGFFRYPMSKACPNKICVMKGFVEVTSGQHYAKLDGYTTWKWQGWGHPQIAPINTHSVQVHHFKWDKTAIDRIRSVANVNQPYAFSEEYRKMYKELGKCRFKINLKEPDFMFEKTGSSSQFKSYKNWNKLINKIASI